ncbi:MULTISPECIES: alpha/beta fold hydrolase [Alkalimonas]|uniref:Alpha/beta fold hydrolase n=1 Tax=Alkalimonas mucilaginosa TaxID=3057676 RepID=A0ABU7JHH8_9GAMM|nr:alpha/beta fold hydrolase [Alkalimonas sp. MEB004]MEE2025157.1 alpha/beta fold hydrolase [Alkalimonas sp. MEB004]
MKLFTEQRGSGPYLVLLHGLFGSQDNLAGIARAAESDFTVLSMDLPNHGRSPHTDAMNYRQMAQAVLDSLPDDADSFYLLGHSMGGKTAMQLALIAPQRVKALLVADIAPVAYEARHNQIIEAMQAVELAKLQTRQDADKQLARSIAEPGVRQFLLKNLLKTGEQFSWRCNLAVIAKRYHEVQAAPKGEPYTGPVLFIKGANSDYILPEHQGAIQALFPQAKAKIIHGAGHWLHAEKPAAFHKIVLDFLHGQAN